MKLVPWSLRRLLRVLLVPVLVLPAPLPAAEAAPPQRHLLWHVTGHGGEGWLFGSLHFGRRDMYPMPAAVDAAWSASDELIVELDADRLSAAEMQRAVAAVGLYPNGQRLEQHIPAADWARVKNAAAGFDVPLALLQQQRPWLVAVTLTTLELARGGWSELLGVDRHFLGRARDRRPIVELESFASQMSLFRGLSPVEQVGMLASTLDDLEEGDRLFAAMANAWRHGDAAAMDLLVNGSIRAQPGGERLYRVLIADRNVAMAEGFERRVAAGAKPFLVVGAGHMVGRDGLPALLRAQGWTVEQVTTPAEQAATAQ